jgi:uncharacterized membrane protein
MSKNSTWIVWAENALFFWCGLSLILALGGDQLLVPVWLQVLGRMHPLILHFPIVLLLLAVLLSLMKDQNWKNAGAIFLLFGANLAGITVVAGLILAGEDYEGSSLDWHKWLGLGSLLIATLIYFFREKSSPIFKFGSAALALTIVATGHFGANLTHGEDFLFVPLLAKKEKKITIEDAVVFEDLVKPILENKCMACHKEGKIKGELRMDQLAGLQKGGKTGPFLIAGNPDESLFFQRIHLPLENEEHMPPKNKAQLTDEEIEILRLWVASGASFEQKVLELEADQPLFQLASQKFSSEANYDFEAPSESDLASLNTFFRKAKPLFPGSPAVEVAYFGASAFDPSSLQDLKKVKSQLLKLNLNRMPLEGVDLSILRELESIAEIQLNFTGLTSDQLQNLTGLSSLRKLAISGNKLDSKSLDYLSKMTFLRELYIWQSGYSEEEKKQLQTQLSNTKIDFGFDSKGVVYALNPPKIEFEQVLFTESAEVKITHPISSVEIRYTLDGSEPDSVSSLIYKKPISLTKTSQIRTKAFAPEWTGSEETKAILFKKGMEPKSYQLKTQPNIRYEAKGATTLFDGIKGKANHTSGEWLGYTDSPLELEIYLKEGDRPNLLDVSLLINEGAYIFPPTSVEIWIGNQNQWKKVTANPPSMPEKSGEPRYQLLSFELPGEPFDQIRLKLNPIAKLPAWHQGAGAKGWVFVDEILIY